MNPRRLLPTTIALLCLGAPAGGAWAAEDPTYVTGLQHGYFATDDGRLKTDGPTLMHVEAGSFARAQRAVWVYTLDPQEISAARWGEVSGRMKVCTEPGAPAPNVDVAFYLDTTSNLGEVDGHPAWKAPAPGTCNENRFSFPVPPPFASVHLGLQLIRYEGTGAAVWVEWADALVKAVDLRDPVVRLASATGFAVPADDLGRSSVTIPAQADDLESGPRELQGSIDGGSWRSVPGDPTFALAGFGSHEVRLRAVDNAGRTGESVTYSVRSYGRPIGLLQPVLAGRPRAGDVLDAGSAGWDGRGSSVDALAHQWLRDGVPLAGATSSTYTLTESDVGTRLAVSVSAHNEAGWSDALRSAGTSPADGIPATAAVPTIVGRPAVGSHLVAANGGWAGSGPLVFAYQWERCPAVASSCTAISGGVGQAYVATEADLGSSLRVRISGSNAWGDDVSTSEATSFVMQPSEPVSATDEPDRPRLRGTPSVGSTVTADVGSFSGTRPFTYAFRWLRCDSFGETCVSIKGAKGQSYRPTSSDLGRTLRSDVTAANASGSATSRTRASSLVTRVGGNVAGSAPASKVEVVLTAPFKPGKVGDGTVAWQLASSRLELVARATRYRVRAGKSLVVSGRYSGDLGVRPRSVRVAATPIVAGAGRYQRTVVAIVDRRGRFSVRLTPFVNSTITVDTPSTSRIQGATLAIGRVGVVPRIRVNVTASQAGGLLSSPHASGNLRPRVAGVQLIWQARAGAVQRLVCAPSEQPRSGRKGAINARCSGVGIDPTVEFRLAFVPSGASAAMFLAAASPWRRAVVR